MLLQSFMIILFLKSNVNFSDYICRYLVYSNFPLKISCVLICIITQLSSYQEITDKLSNILLFVFAKTGTDISSKQKKIGKKECKWTEHDLSHYGVEFFLHKIYETIVLAFKNIFVGMLFQLKFASFSGTFSSTLT